MSPLFRVTGCGLFMNCRPELFAQFGYRDLFFIKVNSGHFYTFLSFGNEQEPFAWNDCIERIF